MNERRIEKEKKNVIDLDRNQQGEDQGHKEEKNLNLDQEGDDENS